MSVPIVREESGEELTRSPLGSALRPNWRTARRVLATFVALEGLIRFLRHALHSHGAGWDIAARGVGVVFVIALVTLIIARTWQAARKGLEDRRAMR